MKDPDHIRIALSLSVEDGQAIRLMLIMYKACLFTPTIIVIIQEQTYFCLLLRVMVQAIEFYEGKHRGS
jgi:hypothetical protein